MPPRVVVVVCFHCTVQNVLELVMQPRSALNCQSQCLRLLKAGITITPDCW